MDGRTEVRLHVVCGPPASGKSVYGQRLARELGGVYLDNDVATEPVVQAGLTAAGLSPDDRDSPTYKEIYREPVYECLLQLAEANLHSPVHFSHLTTHAPTNNTGISRPLFKKCACTFRDLTSGDKNMGFTLKTCADLSFQDLVIRDC